nr:MAG TPA: Rio2, N-terminal [Caudoviricetes sp.]
MNLNGLTLISLANVKNAEVQKLDVYLSGENMISREMSKIETNVLNLIVNRASFEEPIKAEKVRQETGLSKRSLEEVIESLRVNFKHPIVAKKTQPSGYYLPRNEEERQAGLAPYRRQILTEQKNLATVMAVDLKKYWSA